MQKDEQAIRELVNRWMVASKNGDAATVLSLMADDVIFMVPGREPFGKQAFAANATNMKKVQIDGTSHSGYTLTILRKNPDGSWVIARDANLLTQQQPESPGQDAG